MTAPTLVLDLDGTLTDSVPGLTDSLNRVMKPHGHAAFTRPEVTRMVGDGAAALVARALMARGAAPDPAMLDAFLADYGAHATDGVSLYPDVAATLAQFAGRGWRLAVCTNKPEAPARTMLTALGIARFMAAIGGGDSFPVRKPDPAHLLATLHAAGGDVSRAVMVGDHRNDVQAAAGAGMPCIFAQWGYGLPEMAAGAAALAARFADLPDMAARLMS